MIELGGQVGELRFTVEVTRAATGVKETVELIGVIDAEKLKALQDAGIIQEGVENGSNTQHSST